MCSNLKETVERTVTELAACIYCSLSAVDRTHNASTEQRTMCYILISRRPIAILVSVVASGYKNYVEHTFYI